MGDLTKELNTSFTNERVKALINIKFTASWLDAIGNDLLKAFNISLQQFNILRILRGAQKAITVNMVKDKMIQKSPNATRLMDKLCDKGFIERSRCENDRRVVYVQISNEGLEILTQINIDKLNNYMNVLTLEEAKQLNKLLDKIR